MKIDIVQRNYIARDKLIDLINKKLSSVFVIQKREI